MNYYFEITIEPNAEMRENWVLNKVYTKLHRALFDIKSTDIGVSFPRAEKKLGCVIRVHSAKESLQKLQNLNWLGGISGYCKVSDILPVPEKIAGYRTVSRIQQNMTNSKLKRLLKRGTISETEAKKYKARMLAEGLDEPYLELKSKSTGEKYRIYIAFGDLQTQVAKGEFNFFGLSKTATVPWF